MYSRCRCFRCCKPHHVATHAGLVSPGDLLYVGRYLSVGSTQGLSPDPSALLALRVVRTSGLDVECEALTAASLTGLVTVWHPGGQQQQKQQVGSGKITDRVVWCLWCMCQHACVDTDRREAGQLELFANRVWPPAGACAASVFPQAEVVSAACTAQAAP